VKYLIVFLVLIATDKPKERAKPPEKFKKSSVFEDDAFKLLVGERQKQVIKENVKIEEKEESSGDFDRRDMMKKINRAEEILAESLNNSKSFTAASSKINSSADLLIMMGRTLFHSDPDYNDDDDYLKQAEEMTNNAKLVKLFVKKEDYEGASRAFSNVKKNCNSCHEKFK
jgi:cytochrome c556